MNGINIKIKKEFGDYQTPNELSDKICDYLKNERHINPQVVIEPTCGLGNFLASSLIFNAEKYYGIEIDSEYCCYAKNRFSQQNVTIFNNNIFNFNTKSLIENFNDILVIGNPPWINNSTLSVLESDNLPQKINYKALKGLNAKTGASNFDICEYIIWHFIKELQNTNTIIAMLCKTSVARNIFAELNKQNINYEFCDTLEIDTQKFFQANASACALIIKLTPQYSHPNIFNIFSLNKYKETPKVSFRYVNNNFYNYTPSQTYNFDGKCCLEWRQGIKHDCSKIMELSQINNKFFNGLNEQVYIEDDLLYPLIKSSMFKQPIINSFTKYVIVTQKKLNERTGNLEILYPKAWHYLNEHIEYFNKRKSSIYKKAPQFSMFGIGDYSFAPYKVGISGFYKKPIFSLIYSQENQPVFADDTSYFIGFNNYNNAYATMLILNSQPVQEFLSGIVFLDAKRPYTKKVLSRLSFSKIFQHITLKDLLYTERYLQIPTYITEEMYINLKNMPVFQKSEQMKLA